jgi:UDP-N-acetylglucosamine--N-acetylmuramyl-(pentapeptide) pyrophosphoryl-undecaprenol N-acetylglucosamine transferase
MIERVIVAGGGTGGHLFPGIAVVEELRRRSRKIDVLFVGTERGIENRVLAKLGEKLALLDVKPLKGQGALGVMRNLSRLPGAMAEAMSILRAHKPQVVIGLGGYAAGPMLLMAAGLRMPTALLEQNAQVGLTNRMLAPVVGRAYLTYPQTAGAFGVNRARVLGNPVRRALVEAAQIAQSDPRGVEARSRCILVLGGSQGAQALNRSVPEALASAGVADRGIAVLHQAGAAAVADVQARYDALGIRASVVPFIDDMARAYASASLIIARAGATSLAEICAIGRPSILVPYPHAADDHQTRNAEALERAGAAIMVRESELSGPKLADVTRALLEHDDRRRTMALAARAEGRPEAAAAIVDDLLEWLGERHGGAVSDPEITGHGTPSDEPGASELAAMSLHAGAVRKPRVRRCELRLHTIEANVLVK